MAMRRRPLLVVVVVLSQQVAVSVIFLARPIVLGFVLAPKTRHEKLPSIATSFQRYNAKGTRRLDLKASLDEQLAADKAASSMESVMKRNLDAGEKFDIPTCVGALNAWMVAFHKNDQMKDMEIKTMEYGELMEELLSLMEEHCRPQTREIADAIEPYAIVIHMYLQGDPMQALRVLSRMENHLFATTFLAPISEQDNQLRLIQHNRVLQGLSSSPEVCSLIAVPLLLSMAYQEETAFPKYERIEPFCPTGLFPNAKSFAVVLEPLLRLNKKVNAFHKPICWVLQAAAASKQVGLSDGYLYRKMKKAMQDDTERLHMLFVEAGVIFPGFQ